MTLVAIAASNRRRAWGLWPVALLLAACPDPGPEPQDACSGGDGDPEIHLADREGAVELSDGDELAVFPPPQGGVFTELDATLVDMRRDELVNLRVDVVNADTGASLAAVRYFGDQIPLSCVEEGLQTIDNLPVGFSEELFLPDLDGAAVVLTGTLETDRGDFATSYAVTLRATDY